MVMEYMPEGNLREYLQKKVDSNDCDSLSNLSLMSKLGKLANIAQGLRSIHYQNLIHRDLHSGNILNNSTGLGEESYITDLGLSQPVSYQKKEGQIFGVLPYIAPEVLQGRPYTKTSDIYSFGIIAYELLANSYPYPDKNEVNLTLKICQGYRPDIDSVLIPQLLKDLIKQC
jgi:serine/threonine protein kinase